MSLIQLENISKSFFGKELFKNLSFTLHEGERLALIGENGAGKTTLCRLILGKETLDTGKLHCAKKITTAYLSQHLEKEESDLLAWQSQAWLQAEARLQENLFALEKNAHSPQALQNYQEALVHFESLGAYDYKNRLAQILAKLSLPPTLLEQKLSSCSGGEQMRIALAKVLLQAPDLLILDEPTNHLDLNAIEWLVSYLQKYKGTLLFISHDRYFLNALATRCVFMEKNLVRSFQGNFEKASALKEAEEEQLDLQMERLQKEIQRQEEVTQTFLSHRNISGYHQREKWVKKLQDQLQSVKEKRAISQHRMQFRFVPESLEGDKPKTILQFKMLEKAFEEKEVLKGVDFSLKMQDKVILLGANGTGKTTLLKILAGALMADAGEMKMMHNLGFAYMSQNVSFENEEATCLETLFSFTEETEGHLKNRLALFGFRDTDVYKRVSVLSGGERSRLSLCCILAAKPHLLLLDEPTNHLDLYSREILEKAIREYQGAVIAISHDRYFIEHFAHRFCLLNEGKLQEYTSLQQALKEMEKQQERLWSFSFSSHQKKKEKKEEVFLGQVQKEEKQNLSQRRKEKQKLLQTQKTIEKHLEELEKLKADLMLHISEKHLPEDYVRLAEIEEAQAKEEEALFVVWENLQGFEE